MSLSSTVFLGGLRLQAQQRTDSLNNKTISTQEWNGYISNSYKELYDLLIAAYGEQYSVATPYQFTSIPGTNLYNLPSNFYKLLGVDIQSTASPTGWVTLKTFEFIERNKFAGLNFSQAAAQQLQLWMIPEPTSLLFMPVCGVTSSSTSVSVSDSTDLTVGMSVAGPMVSGTDVIPTGTTVTAINTVTNMITLSAPATATLPITVLQFWTDAASVDGISGWEEYIIVDACIKASVKLEDTNVDAFSGQKAGLTKRIEAMANGRDAGQAHHVSDALNLNGSPEVLGYTNFRYALLGSQLMLIPWGADGSGMAGDWGMY